MYIEVNIAENYWTVLGLVSTVGYTLRRKIIYLHYIG
jgi:hypothetical protein